MSFQKLIQPECGAPNPLVVAANQLNATSMPPGVSSSRNILRGPIQTANSLVGEFMSKEKIQQQHQAIQNLQDNFTLTGQQRLMLPPHTTGVHHLWADQYLNQQHAQWDKEFLAKTSAGSITTSNNQQQSNNKHQLIYPSSGFLFRPPNFVTSTDTLDQVLKSSNQIEFQKTDSAKVVARDIGDDIEFWQDLAEKTGMSERSKDDTENDYFDPQLLANYDLSEPLSEYIFDDTNPLKDQFEDPFSEGIKKLDQGDIPSAVLLFEAAVQKEPNNSLAWRYLGTTQAQNENDSMAIRALEKCCNLDANDLVAKLAMAVSLANETRHRAACIQLIEWLARNPAYENLMRSKNIKIMTENEVKINTHQTYGMNLVSDEEYDSVKEVYVSAARLSPENVDPEVQCALGVLFNIRGEYLKAVDCFKAALSVRPEDSLLWNRLGASLANGSRSEEAVSAYRQALKLSPGFLRSRYNLAVSCINLNSYKEAAEQLVTVLNIQAAGRGLNNSRARVITSTNVWNTLRTVVTLMNRPDLYSYIDGKDLEILNREFFSNTI